VREKSKITLRTVAALKAASRDYFIWDADVIGFGLKVNAGGKKVYVLQYRFQQRTRRYVIGTHGAPWTPELARAEAQRLLGSVNSHVDVQSEKLNKRLDPTVAELCDQYLKIGLATKKLSAVDAARSDIENHIKPLLGSRKAAGVSRADIEKLLIDVANGATARAQKGEKRRSLRRVRGGKGAANSVVMTLKAAFSWGIPNGIRDDNPTDKVAKFPENKRERFLSAAELVRLGEVLAAADSLGVESCYAIAAIRLLAMTGCRRNEILELKRNYIDYPNRCLRLPDSKTGAKVVHVGPEVLGLLRSIPEVAGNPYVLPGRNGEGHLVCLQKAWERIRKAADLTDVRLHDLRHSFASFGANSGDSLLIIGALLGHRSAKSTERYAHLAATPVKEAASRISGEIAQLLGAAVDQEGEPGDLTLASQEELAVLRPVVGDVIKARYLDTRAVAARVGMTVGTLQTYRWMGIGPPFQKIGRRVVYSEHLVDQWIRTSAAAKLMIAD
jgi:integrase